MNYELNETTGLPIGAEFVAARPPRNGEFYITAKAVIVVMMREHLYPWVRTVISFPTYGMPLHLVDLKGRKLLGGGMTTAWRVPCVGAEFINVSGHIEVCTYDVDDSYRICLEPLSKKRKVLVLELPIDEDGKCKIQGYPSALQTYTFDAGGLRVNYGGTIKEVDDAA